MRGFAAGMALVLLTGAAAPQDSNKTSPDRERRAAYGEALAAYNRRDCATALKLIEPRLTPAELAQTPGPVQAMGYEVAARCKWQGDDAAAAYRYALAGTALDDASDGLWQVRLGTVLFDDKFEPAVATVEAMTQGRGGALNAVPVRWLYQLSRKLRDAKQDALSVRLLRVLTDNAYDPDEVTVSKDGFRWSYAEVLHRTGDLEGAAAQIRQIQGASLLADVSLDLRFRTMLPANLDYKALAEARLAETRELMQRHPELLDPLTDVARQLRMLGRPKEAIAVLESARAGGRTLDAYKDAGDQLNWWWDELGRAQEMLGNADAAVAAFRAGAAAGEDGSPNVSQTINLAHAQIRFGRLADALATLKPIEGEGMGVSPYGEMEMRLARGCAQSLLGNAAAAAADRAFVEAHAKDHPEAASNLFLCMNDLDAAAASFIGRLDDPEKRSGALMQLSEFAPPPVKLPDDPVDSKLPALKARADVQAAIVRAGGTGRFPLQRGTL